MKVRPTALYLTIAATFLPQRFPELHTILTRKGATILTFPSAFTLKTGKDHWATLLKSIAITFQGASGQSPPYHLPFADHC